MIQKILSFNVYKDGGILHLSQASGLVGSFRMELAAIHHEPDHCYENKWLLLTGPKGYSGEAVVWNRHERYIIKGGHWVIKEHDL